MEWRTPSWSHCHRFAAEDELWNRNHLQKSPEMDCMYKASPNCEAIIGFATWLTTTMLSIFHNIYIYKLYIYICKQVCTLMCTASRHTWYTLTFKVIFLVSNPTLVVAAWNAVRNTRRAHQWTCWMEKGLKHLKTTHQTTRYSKYPRVNIQKCVENPCILPGKWLLWLVNSTSFCVFTCEGMKVRPPFTIAKLTRIVWLTFGFMGDITSIHTLW